MKITKPTKGKIKIYEPFKYSRSKNKGSRGFDVSYNQREYQLVVKFKTNSSGFWSNK